MDIPTLAEHFTARSETALPPIPPKTPSPKRGRPKGVSRKLTIEDTLYAIERRAKGHSFEAIARALKVCWQTVKTTIEGFITYGHSYWTDTPIPLLRGAD